MIDNKEFYFLKEMMNAQGIDMHAIRDLMSGFLNLIKVCEVSCI